MGSDLDTVEAIVRSFRRVNRAINHHVRESAEQLNTTPVQTLVLQMLWKNPNIGLGELAENLQLGSSTMSGVVERLVEAGLIVRGRHPEDRRILTIRLTPEGEKIRQKAFGEDSLLHQRLMNLMELEEEDIGQLLRIHEKVLEILQLRGDETIHDD